MPEEKRVSEWALEWLEKQMQRGLSKNTAGSYRQWTCQRIVPEFLDIALTDLTEAHIQDFYESLACKGLSQNSIWCGHLILRKLLDEQAVMDYWNSIRHLKSNYRIRRHRNRKQSAEDR